jgi:class 3 adenylate cyclase
MRVRSEGTVLVARQRGFTALAEKVINRRLGGMHDAVAAQGGTLVTLVGDGITAVFDQHDHAVRAVAAARDMLASASSRAEVSEPLRLAIGVSSDEPTTDVAVRLQELADELGAALLVSDATRARLDPAPGDLLYLGEMKLEGRDGRIVVWALDRPSRRIEAHTS